MWEIYTSYLEWNPNRFVSIFVLKTAILLSQGIIPTYVPKYVDEQDDDDEPEPIPLHSESREDLIRRLKVIIYTSKHALDITGALSLAFQEQQEQVARELKELEDIRRLRVCFKTRVHTLLCYFSMTPKKGTAGGDTARARWTRQFWVWQYLTTVIYSWRYPLFHFSLFL